MTDWWLMPLSGSTEHNIAPWAMWHARCMVLAWGVLLPVGVLVARFFKVLPGQDWPRQLDHKAWWHAHRGLQWAGVAVMLVGLGLAWNAGGGGGGSSGVGVGSSGGGTGAGINSPTSALAQWHGWAGWAVCALGALQIASGLARGDKGGPTAKQLRGDHYDMTPWRCSFERLHKGLGWLALLAAVAVIAAGLVLADAPRWMAAVLAMWWWVLVAAFVMLQRAGRCIDTYQAIWGPDARHPGNRRPPIGWGVRRPLG